MSNYIKTGFKKLKTILTNSGFRITTLKDICEGEVLLKKYPNHSTISCHCECERQAIQLILSSYGIYSTTTRMGSRRRRLIVPNDPEYNKKHYGHFYA